jgi:hypothetical protein
MVEEVFISTKGFFLSYNFSIKVFENVLNILAARLLITIELI